MALHLRRQLSTLPSPPAPPHETVPLETGGLGTWRNEMARECRFEERVSLLAMCSQA